MQLNYFSRTHGQLVVLFLLLITSFGLNIASASQQRDARLDVFKPAVLRGTAPLEPGNLLYNITISSGLPALPPGGTWADPSARYFFYQVTWKPSVVDIDEVFLFVSLTNRTYSNKVLVGSSIIDMSSYAAGLADAVQIPFFLRERDFVLVNSPSEFAQRTLFLLGRRACGTLINASAVELMIPFETRPLVFDPDSSKANDAETVGPLLVQTTKDEGVRDGWWWVGVIAILLAALFAVIFITMSRRTVDVIDCMKTEVASCPFWAPLPCVGTSVRVELHVLAFDDETEESLVTRLMSSGRDHTSESMLRKEFTGECWVGMPQNALAGEAKGLPSDAKYRKTMTEVQDVAADAKCTSYRVPLVVANPKKTSSRFLNAGSIAPRPATSALTLLDAAPQTMQLRPIQKRGSAEVVASPLLPATSASSSTLIASRDSEALLRARSPSEVNLGIVLNNPSDAQLVCNVFITDVKQGSWICPAKSRILVDRSSLRLSEDDCTALNESPEEDQDKATNSDTVRFLYHGSEDLKVHIELVSFERAMHEHHLQQMATQTSPVEISPLDVGPLRNSWTEGVNSNGSSKSVTSLSNVSVNGNSSSSLVRRGSASQDLLKRVAKNRIRVAPIDVPEPSTGKQPAVGGIDEQSGSASDSDTSSPRLARRRLLSKDGHTSSSQNLLAPHGSQHAQRSKDMVKKAGINNDQEIFIRAGPTLKQLFVGPKALADEATIDLSVAEFCVWVGNISGNVQLQDRNAVPVESEVVSVLRPDISTVQSEFVVMVVEVRADGQAFLHEQRPSWSGQHVILFGPNDECLSNRRMVPVSTVKLHDTFLLADDEEGVNGWCILVTRGANALSGAHADDNNNVFKVLVAVGDCGVSEMSLSAAGWSKRTKLQPLPSGAVSTSVFVRGMMDCAFSVHFSGSQQLATFNHATGQYVSHQVLSLSTFAQEYMAALLSRLPPSRMDHAILEDVVQFVSSRLRMDNPFDTSYLVDFGSKLFMFLSQSCYCPLLDRRECLDRRVSVSIGSHVIVPVQESALQFSCSAEASDCLDLQLWLNNPTDRPLHVDWRLRSHQKNGHVVILPFSAMREVVSIVPFLATTILSLRVREADGMASELNDTFVTFGSTVLSLERGTVPLDLRIRCTNPSAARPVLVHADAPEPAVVRPSEDSHHVQIPILEQEHFPVSNVDVPSAELLPSVEQEWPPVEPPPAEHRLSHEVDIPTDVHEEEMPVSGSSSFIDTAVTARPSPASSSPVPVSSKKKLRTVTSVRAVERAKLMAKAYAPFNPPL
jgi:hypothetical protein